MDMDEVIQTLREHYSVLQVEYGVTQIGIFGSAAKGAMTEESDLDIVVEFQKPIGFGFFRLIEYLERVFGRKVNILTKEGIKNIRVEEVAKHIEEQLIYV